MSDSYGAITELTRPRYGDISPMSASDRAAQFSPFAALVGYDAAVDETARLTDSRTELTEDEINSLNASLNLLLDRLDEQPEVRVVYFVPDERKSGGRYAEKVGTVRIYGEYANERVFTDGERVAVADMLTISLPQPTEQPDRFSANSLLTNSRA